jgi:hypothetical protein
MPEAPYAHRALRSACSEALKRCPASRIQHVREHTRAQRCPRNSGATVRSNVESARRRSNGQAACQRRPKIDPLSVLGTPGKGSVRRFRCLASFRIPCSGRWTAVEGRGGAPAAQRGRTTSRPTRIRRILDRAGRLGNDVVQVISASGERGGGRRRRACRRPALSGSTDKSPAT